MSGAGLLVVGTLCLSLLLVLVTVCALVLRGMEVPGTMETIVAALLTGVPALLARSWQERKSANEPVEVVGQAGAPVVVEQAGDLQVDPA